MSCPNWPFRGAVQAIVSSFYRHLQTRYGASADEEAEMVAIMEWEQQKITEYATQGDVDSLLKYLIICDEHLQMHESRGKKWEEFPDLFL